MNKRFLLSALSIFAAACFLVGCGDKAQPYVLIIECDDAIARRAVEVDLIGVNPSDKDQILGCSVNQYWNPEGKIRPADRVTKVFGAGHPRRYEMRLTDAETKKTWANWMSRGVTDLVIIANLKTVTTDAPGVADPRRKLIPLKTKALQEMYPKAKAFRVLVQDASVRIDPLGEIPKDAAK